MDYMHAGDHLELEEISITTGGDTSLSSLHLLCPSKETKSRRRSQPKDPHISPFLQESQWNGVERRLLFELEAFCSGSKDAKE